MKKVGPFRAWVYHQWLANCDEHDLYHEPKISLKEYWEQYKKFLKKQYRVHQSNEEKLNAYKKRYSY